MDVPDIRVQGSNAVEIVLSGKTEVCQLPGESAQHADTIATNLKDAVIAAVLNKSKFKLKLFDIKNGKGEITETALQAEYDRAGMVPIRIWVLNNRGEVGALASVLRKAVSTSLPELAA